MPRYAFERTVGGQRRTFLIEHHPLSDRLTVESNGDQVPVTLHRKPFSGLWRYAFTVAGEALEVRVRTSGLREIEVSLHAASDLVEKKPLPAGALAGIAAGALLLSLVALPGPTSVNAAIGLFAGLGAAFIVGVVSRRA